MAVVMTLKYSCEVKKVLKMTMAGVRCDECNATNGNAPET